MGAKASTQSGEATSPPRTRTFSTSSNSEVVAGPAFSLLRSLPSVTGDRQRTRSLSGVGEAVSAVRTVRTYDISESGETDSGEEGGPSLPSIPSLHSLPPNIRVYSTHSLPSHIWTTYGIKCPMCAKFLLPDDIECHLVMCLTKPRLSYNEDVLAEEKGECVICLEDLSSGHTIARLPCLCIYHKGCIDRWFQVNRSCPEHPGD